MSGVIRPDLAALTLAEESAGRTGDNNHRTRIFRRCPSGADGPSAFGVCGSHGNRILDKEFLVFEAASASLLHSPVILTS